MSRTSHFTARTQLGTEEDDILIAGRSKGERLYGGAGDDLLVSVDGGDYAHGGSGADIFAFRFNKNIRRSAQRGKSVDHVIEDFNLDEGDSICLSHIVTKSRHKNIDYRGVGRIKGTGIEVRLVQGKRGAAKKEQEAFTGIEDGVEKTIGELPEISKTRRNGVDSRLEVYEDGNLVSNITLKNTPRSRSFSRRLGKAIYGKYSQTGKEVSSINGINGDHLSQLSVTSLGIPMKGNGAKLDHANADETIASSAISSLNAADSTHNLNMKSQVMAGFSTPFKIDFPNYKYAFDLGFVLSANPKLILNSGHMIGVGSVSYKPDALSYTQELEPPFTANASAGGRISVTTNIDKRGTGKQISTGIYLVAEVEYTFKHHGIYTNDTEIIKNAANVGGYLTPSSNSSTDDVTGVQWNIGFAPYAQFTVGLGVGEGTTRVNAIQTGPRLTIPFTLSVNGDTGKSTFKYGTADLDWTVILGSVQAFGLNFTGPSYNIGLADFGSPTVQDISW